MRRFLNEIINCNCSTFEERRSLIFPVFFISLAAYLGYFAFFLMSHHSFNNHYFSKSFQAFALFEICLIASFILSKKLRYNPVLAIGPLGGMASALYLLSDPLIHQMDPHLYQLFQISALLFACYLSSIRCNVMIGFLSFTAPLILAQYMEHIDLNETFFEQRLIFFYAVVSLFFVYRNTIFKKDVLQMYQEADNLRKSRKEILNAINQSAVVVHTDTNGIIESFNKAFIQLNKATPEYFLNQKRFLFDFMDEHPLEETKIRQAFKTGETWMGEVFLRNHLGTGFWVFATLTPRYDNENNLKGSLAIWHDITEKKQIELELQEERNKLIHTSKLATIGELAAGVGHEINNPLAIAKGQIRAIKRKLKLNHDLKDYEIKQHFEYLEDSTHRIRNIVDGLRNFSRIDDNKMQDLNLGDTVDQSLVLLREIYEKENIKILWEPPQDDLSFKGVEGKIQQVIMNLLSNARDSILDTIGDSSEESSKPKVIEVKTGLENSSVYLEVSDTGGGISEAIKDKIFEPFFTSKPIGKGTGIGLPLSKAIIEEHGGSLSFKSSPKGTTFILKLPHHKKKKSDYPDLLHLPEDLLSPNIPTSPLNILIVDDELGIRLGLRDILETELGAHVTEATNGKEGLDMMEKNPFDIVITDLKMPIMDGFSLAQKARELLLEKCPTIVAMTGGTKQNIDNPETMKNFDALLLKPFEEKDLFALFHELNLEQREIEPKPQIISS